MASLKGQETAVDKSSELDRVLISDLLVRGIIGGDLVAAWPDDGTVS